MDSGPIAASASPLELPFSFDGTAGEYFRIWAVNLALVVLTLGLFAPWAKVRKRRYLYAHTRIGPFPFQYLADPWPIFYGRMIALVLLLGYVVAGSFAPAAQPFAAAIVALAAPWLVVRSLRFRARYSSLAAVRFGFVGPTPGAYVYYLLAFALVPLTLGLAYPAIKAWQRRYVADHHRLGGRELRMRAATPAFYALYLGAALLPVLGVAVAVGAAAAAAPELLPAAAVAGGYAGVLLAYARISAGTWNLVYGTLELEGGHRLASSLRAGEVSALWLTNLIAVVATLGLAVPWAVIRMARYRAERTTLHPAGPLEGFEPEPTLAEGPTGAEAAELFDVEIGL